MTSAQAARPGAARSGAARSGAADSGTTDELRAYRMPVVSRNRGTVWFLALTAAAIVFAVPISIAVAYGNQAYESIALSNPGTTTIAIAAAAHALATAATWVLFGALVSLLFLLAVPGRDRDLVHGEPELRWAQIAAGVWMAASGALIVIDAADKNGQPLTRIFEPGALSYLIDASDYPKAWVVSFLLAAVAFLVLLFVDTWRGLLVPLWCLVIGSLAPIVVGHILVGPNHDFGSDAGTIQSVTGGALFGMVWMLSARIATGRLLRPATIRRAMGLALALWVPTALADLILIPFKLGAEDEGNPTWMLLTLRAGILLLVGGVILAAWLRRRVLTERALTGGLVVLTMLGAVFLGLTLAMERIPPPQFFWPSTIMTVLFGFELTQAPTVDVLFTVWRPNVLFIVIATVAVAVYVAAMIRIRRRGDRWPIGRAVAWIAGWFVVVFSTSSGFGMYSGSDFGIHMIVHMGLNMLAPVLMVMGGVVTLLLRATTPHRPGEAAGPHEWITTVLNWKILHVLYNPLVVFILFIGSYYGLYLTGLFEQIIPFHWAHQAMNIHFLITGYLFYSLIIGVDRPPKPLPPVGKLGFVLAAMPFHAFFGVILMMSTTPIAENFYLTLYAPWNPDLMLQQYIGGGVAWAGGELPLILVIVALGIQWARQDQREAKRKDRHLDSGLDDEFDAYNRMLDELARRSAKRSGQDAGGAQAAAGASSVTADAVADRSSSASSSEAASAVESEAASDPDGGTR